MVLVRVSTGFKWRNVLTPDTTEKKECDYWFSSARNYNNREAFLEIGFM